MVMGHEPGKQSAGAAAAFVDDGVSLRKRSFLGLAPGAGVTARPGAPVSPRIGRRGRAIAEALFASDSGGPPAERLDWVEREVSDFLSRVDAWGRFIIGLCMWITCRLGPLTAGRLASLERLDVAERQRVLERVERGPAALAFLAVRALLCLVYYEHPDAAREIGFDGLCRSGRTRT